MPVRSLSSRVLKWPRKDEVDRAARVWAAKLAANHPEVVCAGYFGSYARNDWGVGSDLDVVVIVREASEPWHRRSVGWDTRGLPVPVDLLIYTVEEWEALPRSGRFYRTLHREAVWVYPARGIRRGMSYEG